MKAPKLPPMSEKAFQASVERLAKLYGWRYYHTWRSIRSVAGFPDLVLCRARDRRVIFAELKRDGKRPTAAQQEWIDDLRSVGRPVECYVWRPADLQAIAEILQ
jgi:hypothetical protein